MYLSLFQTSYYTDCPPAMVSKETSSIVSKKNFVLSTLLACSAESNEVTCRFIVTDARQ